MCNVVGGVLKAVEVRTENGTEDAAHLDAFCIKDKGQQTHTKTYTVRKDRRRGMVVAIRT